MGKQRKRGTRRIVGYVVSLSGKRGGPYAAGLWRSPDIEDAERHHSSESERAEKVANWWKVNAIPPTPDARVLPVVRYELDREEERLRDAVVEAALKETAQADLIREQVSAFHAHDMETWDEGQYAVACKTRREAEASLHHAYRALRAHLEKKR